MRGSQSEQSLELTAHRLARLSQETHSPASRSKQNIHSLPLSFVILLFCWSLGLSAFCALLFCFAVLLLCCFAVFLLFCFSVGAWVCFYTIFVWAVRGKTSTDSTSLFGSSEGLREFAALLLVLLLLLFLLLLPLCLMSSLPWCNFVMTDLHFRVLLSSRAVESCCRVVLSSRAVESCCRVVLSSLVDFVQAHLNQRAVAPLTGYFLFILFPFLVLIDTHFPCENLFSSRKESSQVCGCTERYLKV